MPFTGDPANRAIDRIRLAVGDIDTFEEGLADDVYQYALDITTVSGALNEGLASVEILKFLVAKYANFVTEKAGGLFVKESEKFEQYKMLLDMFTKDPRTSFLRAGQGYAGGISRQDFLDNCNAEDTKQVVFEEEVNEGEFFEPRSFRPV